MKKLKWPETLVHEIYNCKICNKLIDSEYYEDSDGNSWFTPSSRYWNVKSKSVYCSATCSLTHHNANYQ